MRNNYIHIFGLNPTFLCITKLFTVAVSHPEVTIALVIEGNLENNHKIYPKSNIQIYLNIYRHF